MKQSKHTKHFASRWGFILASVGSAVGMANVWGFPNKLGSNGGGAFLLVYLLWEKPADFSAGCRWQARCASQSATQLLSPIS